tara:strand:+ start:3161 stop:3757 length:597 start_codon:yes stop_codon:yes gene_type:complete
MPTGEIVAVPLRGAFLGNRGILHGADRTLGVARWKTQAWVTCVTKFKGRRRALMSPGKYTELFFYDEAVALAAGHRPCGECRREDYRRFIGLWREVHGQAPLADIDKALHKARVRPGRQQVRFEALAQDLPFGTFVLVDETPVVLRDTDALPFGPEGYGAPRPRPTGPVTVLTPAPTVAVLAAGYRPELHGSSASSQS